MATLTLKSAKSDETSRPDPAKLAEPPVEAVSPTVADETSQPAKGPAQMPPDPNSNRQKRNRAWREGRDQHADETRKEVEARRKWMAAHPNVASGPRSAAERPWGDQPKEAERGAPWWGVKRLGPYGSIYHRPIYRHASLETAEREAKWLAQSFPGAVYVVLAMVSVHVVGEPEVGLERGAKPEAA